MFTLPTANKQLLEFLPLSCKYIYLVYYPSYPFCKALGDKSILLHKLENSPMAFLDSRRSDGQVSRCEKGTQGL
jgi:hypothetical protein